MDLKYVGEFFSKRFGRNHIFNQQDLLKRAKRLDRDGLEVLLNKVFRNKRKNKCVPLGDKMYAVREINVRGFNSALGFLKTHRASRGIPYMGRRQYEDAFPKDCFKKAA